MKSLMLIAACLMSFQTWAQKGTDYMGIPTENSSTVVNELVNPKTIQALILPVQKVFASPTSLPTSIAYYDNLLWVTGYNAYVVYKVSPLTGAVVETIPIAIQKPYGVTFNNNQMYIIDNIARNIIVYTMSGVVIDTINLNGIYNALYLTGLCSYDNDLWFNDTKGPNPSASNDSIYSLSAQLQINNSFESVGTFPSGISYDGKYLWVNDNPSQTTNMLDPISHTVLNSIHTPGGAYPNGVACDDNGLWIINNSSDSIYYLMTDEATSVASTEIENIGIKVFSTNNQIIFNYKSEWEGSEIVIFDCTSRIIARQNIPNGNEFVWNNKNKISSGIYYVNVYNKETKFSEKVFLTNN